MKRIQMNSAFVCPVRLTEELKIEVSYRLGTTSTDTLLGIAYRKFADISNRNNQEFQELLIDMFSELQRNPHVVRHVLGKHFEFFSGLFRTEMKSVIAKQEERNLISSTG